MKSGFFILLILAFLSSCSQQGKQVSAKLQISSASIISGQSGGTMLYVINKTNNQQSAVIIDNSQTVLRLEEGPYDFAVLSWAGTNGPFSGTLSCAKASANLVGVSSSVDLSLSADACLDDFFSAAQYRSLQGIHPLSLVDCQSIAGVTASGDCSGNKGNTLSYKVHFLSYPGTPRDNIGALDVSTLSAMSSNCLAADQNPPLTPTEFKIPVGGLGVQPSIVVETFYEANCTQSFRKYFFPQGLAAAESTLANSITFNHLSSTKVFLDSALLSVTGTTNFGSVVMGESGLSTFTIKNLSPNAWENFSITLTGNGFSFDGGTCPLSGQLQINQECTVSVKFSPLENVNYTSGLNFSLDGVLINRALAGSGTAPAVAPAAPTNLTAMATGPVVSLSWTASSGAISYKLYKGTPQNLTLFQSGITSTTYTDTVTPGVSYTYAVVASNTLDSQYSQTVDVFPLASFSITTLVGMTSTTMEVTWPSVVGATAYEILYSTVPGQNYTSITNNVSSPFTITGLTPGTTYYVVVRAKGVAPASVASVDSSPAAGITPVGPPTGLVATNPPTGGVGLTWNLVSGATTYKVYRAITSGGPYTLLDTVSGPAYLDLAVTNGSSYFYVVTSSNGAESTYSLEVAKKPIASFTLAAVTPLSANSVRVEWTAAAGADSYEVRYGTATGVYAFSDPGVSSPYTLNNLSPNTTYFISVRARNTVGTGALFDSGEMNAKTAVTAPTNLAASATPGNVTLSWTAVAGASSYRVYRGTTSGTHTLLASSITTASYTDSSVTNGTQYFYVVTAHNGIESAKSAEATVLPMANFTVSSISVQGTNSLQVSWTGPGGASAYDVRYGTTSGSYPSTASNVTSPHQITGLTAGTTYYVVIRAKNTIGAGTNLQSSESSAKTAVVAPSGLTATASPGAISLTWTAVQGATNYNIYRGTVSGTYSQIASAITTSSYSDTSVTNGTTYYYVVRSFNGTESANSLEVFRQPVAVPVITAVNAVNSTTLSVVWSAAAGAASYDLQYGTTAGSYPNSISNITGLTANVPNLTAGTTHYVRLVGKNTVGGGSLTTATSLALSGVTNSLPVISTLANQTMNTSTHTVSFTLNDQNNVLTCSGAMAASSSNTTLLNSSGVSFSGTVPNCTATITPTLGQVGTTTVTFSATDGMDTVSKSFTLTVNPCSVASMTWQTQPVNAVAGAAMATAPVVKLLDASNALCATDLTPVGVGIATDGSVTGDAMVDFGATVVPSGGYATFSSLKINRAGNGHTLTAVRGAVRTSVDSNPFNVTAGTASAILFDQQPSSTAVNVISMPAITVRAVDAFGNFVPTSAGAFTVSLNLIDSATSTAVASITGSRTAVPVDATGTVTFSNLSFTATGTYLLEATASNNFAAVNSKNFSVLNTLSPRSAVSVLELIQGPVTVAGNSLIKYLPRSGLKVGSNDINGNVSWTLKVVASNSDLNVNGEIVLKSGTAQTTFSAMMSVPKNSTPSEYTATITSGISPGGVLSLGTRNGVLTIYSARLIASASNSTKSVIYIPLTSLPDTLEFTSADRTNNTSSMPSPVDMYYPVYNFIAAKFQRIDSAEFVFSGLGAHSCASLWNRDSNTMIGHEVCALANESMVTTSIPVSSLPPVGGNIEARLRSTTTGSVATLYKAGLVLKMVALNNLKNVYRIAPAIASVNATKTFTNQRFQPRFGTNLFGTATVDLYHRCRLKAVLAGSGSNFSVVDTNNMNSTVGTSSVPAGSQSFYTLVDSGKMQDPIFGNTLAAKYNHIGGAFDLQHCLLESEITYPSPDTYTGAQTM